MLTRGKTNKSLDGKIKTQEKHLFGDFQHKIENSVHVPCKFKVGSKNWDRFGAREIDFLEMRKKSPLNQAHLLLFFFSPYLSGRETPDEEENH